MTHRRSPTAGSRPPGRRRSGNGAPLLQLSSVDVHYGAVQALRGISLEVKLGEVIALLGANGAGKSSTLRAISGMVTPTAGEISFGGQPIGSRRAHQVVGLGIGHIPEGRELFPTLTVEENLRLGFWPQRGRGNDQRSALNHVYDVFPRLNERRRQAAGTLSGGEQQMLAFGRGLMSSPKLLLIDEMSLGLAPLIVQTLFDAVESINSDGTSVVIVEQFVHLALRHSHRAYVLSKGQVVLEAKSKDLESDPKLVAAYLGGAEGHIEEQPVKAEEKKTRRTKSVRKK